MRAAREQSGFTMIEVMVAALLLAIGVFASLSLFDVTTRATLSAERNQVAVNRAQREMEDLRALDYSQVALTGAPASSSDTNDPRSRVAAGQFQLAEGDSASLADLVINGQPGVSAGAIDPGPTSFSTGKVSGKVYRFAVWRDDPKCSTCEGTHDFKRVVVAVKLDSTPISGGSRKYIEIQADFANPEEGVQGSAPPPENPNPITANQLHLTDTSCNASARQPIEVVTGTDGHPLHNTLGPCSAGKKQGASGTTPGAPDLLLLSPAPDPTPADPNDPPLYDYATDLEPGPPADPASDKGLQLQTPNNPGCTYNPSSQNEPNARQIQHRWLTPPLPQAFTATGKATLKLYTRTAGQTISPGKLCIYLFTRNTVDLDSMIVNSTTSLPYFTYQLTNWPDGTGDNDPRGFGRVAVQMNFQQLTIPPGQRLGLAIGEERGGTGSDLELAYDDPQLDSYLEVSTSTPLNSLP